MVCGAHPTTTRAFVVTRLRRVIPIPREVCPFGKLRAGSDGHSTNGEGAAASALLRICASPFWIVDFRGRLVGRASPHDKASGDARPTGMRRTRSAGGRISSLAGATRERGWVDGFDGRAGIRPPLSEGRVPSDERRDTPQGRGGEKLLEKCEKGVDRLSIGQ